MSHEQNHIFVQSQIRECMKSCLEAYSEASSIGLTTESEQMKNLYSELIDLSQEFDIYTTIFNNKNIDINAIDEEVKKTKNTMSFILQNKKKSMMNEMLEGKSNEDEDDGVEFNGGDESAGLICPITSTLPEVPVVSLKCHHVYDKTAIINYINQQTQLGVKKVICPCIGCEQPISMKTIVEDEEITKKVNKAKMNTDKHWEKM